MLTILILLIPTALIFVLMFFFTEKMCLWEYAQLMFVSLAVSYTCYFICSEVATSDTKYTSLYVTKATKYEEWNSRELRSRTVRIGKHSHTQYYYVTVNHPEEYKLTLNDGNAVSVSKSRFYSVVERLQTRPVFVDMHRIYHTKDGDAWRYRFDGEFGHIYEYAVSDTYENRIQSSSSIFKYGDISDDEADSIGLYAYPALENGKQKVVLGKVPGGNVRPIYQMNAECGIKYQFRMFLLFYENASPSVAEYQKAYWKGGNQNELVLCIGHSNGRIQWCEAFSWCDHPILESYCKRYFLTHNRFDGNDFVKYMRPLVYRHWKAKNFSDFDYISVELSTWQIIFILLLTIIADLALGYWLVTNEYDLN